MALHSLYCADVPLKNCSLTHSLSKFIQHLTTEWLIHPSMIPVFCRRQAAIPDAPVQQEIEKTTQLHPSMIPVLCNKKHSRLPCHRQRYV